MQNLAQYLASQYGRSLCISHFFIQGVGLKVEVVCHICMFIPVQYNTIQYSDLLVLRRLSSTQPSVITLDLLVLRRLSFTQEPVAHQHWTLYAESVDVVKCSCMLNHELVSLSTVTHRQQFRQDNPVWSCFTCRISCTHPWSDRPHSMLW